MPTSTAIRRVCSAFDGKDIVPLEAFALEREGEAGYLAGVFGVAEKPKSEMESVAATWLLLRRFRRDDDGAAEHAGRLAGLLGGAGHPDARLHVIQCLDRAAAGGGFDAAGRKKLAKALRGDLEHERPFVRAWALSVLARLAAETPSVREWVGEAVEDAEANGKASLKARVRQLRKAGVLGWYDG
jgi:hypothetical protein